MDINFTTLFDDFYHTRVFVLICLSSFTLLFTLRLDQLIMCSYWIVFLPLWFWKLTAFIGMITGTFYWLKLSRRRYETDVFVQFKGMLISFVTNLNLFIFELIVCEKLETNRDISWSICFIPLFILSLISTVTCIWSIRYERTYEMELILSLNILQFVFIALRLDSTITWSWVIVLIPLWIIMCIAFVILLYVVILTMIMTRNSSYLMQQHVNQSYRTNQKCYRAFFFAIFIFSLLMFEILLTNKLDHDMFSTDIMQQFQRNRNYMNEMTSYNKVHSSSSSLTAVSIPLYVSYISLIFLSFNYRSGNTWWFGMRRDFCEVFLNMCPIFQTYGNIQIKFQQTNNSETNDDTNQLQLNNSINNQQPRRHSIYLNATNLNNNLNSEQRVNLIESRSNQTSIITLNNTSQPNRMTSNSINSANPALNSAENSSNMVTLSLLNTNINSNDDLNVSIDTGTASQTTTVNINDSNALSIGSLNGSTSRKSQSFKRSNPNKSNNHKVLRNMVALRKSSSKLSNLNKFSFKSNQSAPVMNPNNSNSNNNSNLTNNNVTQTNASDKCSIKSSQGISFVNNIINNNSNNKCCLMLNNNSLSNKNVTKQLDLPD